MLQAVEIFVEIFLFVFEIVASLLAYLKELSTKQYGRSRNSVRKWGLAIWGIGEREGGWNQLKIAF